MTGLATGAFEGRSENSFVKESDKRSGDGWFGLEKVKLGGHIKGCAVAPSNISQGLTRRGLREGDRSGRKALWYQSNGPRKNCPRESG